MDRTATAGPDVLVESGPAPSPALAPPPGNPRFPLFDSLRGIALLGIVTFHVATIGGSLNTPVVGDLLGVIGPTSLLMFFVISGFLLYRPFVAARMRGRRRPSTARYARRRVLRIVPGYWVALTLLAIYPGIVGPFGGNWWRYYLFAQLYSGHTVSAGIPVAWTLSVEVAFYVMLPLWARAARWVRLGSGGLGLLASELTPLAALAAVGVVIQLGASRLLISRLVSDSLLGQCTWLGLGMAVAVFSVAVHDAGLKGRPLRFLADHPGLCWIGAAASLGGLAAVLRPGGGFTILLALTTKQPVAKTLGGILLSGCFLVLLVVPAVFGQEGRGVPRRIMAWAPLSLLGVISYSAYLYHLTVAELIGLRANAAQYSATGWGLAAKLPHARTPILIALTLVGTCVIASLSYRFVELPFLRRKEG